MYVKEARRGTLESHFCTARRLRSEMTSESSLFLFSLVSWQPKLTREAGKMAKSLREEGEEGHKKLPVQQWGETGSSWGWKHGCSHVKLFCFPVRSLLMTINHPVSTVLGWAPTLCLQTRFLKIPLCNIAEIAFQTHPSTLKFPHSRTEKNLKLPPRSGSYFRLVNKALNVAQPALM